MNNLLGVHRFAQRRAQAIIAAMLIDHEDSEKADNFGDIALQLRLLADRLSQLSDDDSDAPLFFQPADVKVPRAQRVRGIRPSLPDPALVRSIINRRHARSSYLSRAKFADPAWDMLLDLTAAKGEERRLSVTSLCIASGVPSTTALRWIGQMI